MSKEVIISEETKVRLQTAMDKILAIQKEYEVGITQQAENTPEGSVLVKMVVVDTKKVPEEAKVSETAPGVVEPELVPVEDND
jgi:hypothetical protein